jgi:hypothetical protein
MKRIFVALSLVIALAIPSTLSVFATTPSTPDQGMQSVWQRTDQPVDQGKVSRTWTWGPTGFATTQEAYAESPGGQRIVEYFDKSRMEITNPNGDRNSQWFVTNSLLTKELITGQMQVGDSKFESHSPANIPVAGDPDDTNGPTYATFASLLSKPAHNVGDQLAETIDKNGNIGTSGPGGVSAAYKVPETNHTVASVFWDFLNSSGTIFGGSYVQGKLFDPTFFATGYPITEAYWAQVKVGGQEKWVLMQCFERRVLTYTPDNPESWKVEMGNIGRHYYDWRYSAAPQPQPTVPSTPTPAPTPAPQPQPQTVAQWSGNGLMQTPLFTTPTGEWTLAWNNIDADAYLGIFVYNSNGDLVDLAANTTEQGPGTYSAHNLQGTYYLVINATGHWTVTIKAP